MSELREMAKEADVPVYAICVTDLNDERAPYGAAVLNSVCRATGGRALFPQNVEQLADCCTLIAIELRHQYTLGFYPTSDDAERRWRKLKVQLDVPADWPRLAVRARPGDYGGWRTAVASAR